MRVLHVRMNILVCCYSMWNDNCDSKLRPIFLFNFFFVGIGITIALIRMIECHVKFTRGRERLHEVMV